MQIGIIGAGRIGSHIVQRLTALGHSVSVANSRGPETLAELAASTGVTPVAVQDVATGAEVVVVTIPLRAVAELPAGVLDGAVPGVAVIDTCNYRPQRDGHIAAIEDGTTESRWLEQQIGGPVIKVFNTINAHKIVDLARPAGAPDRIALPVAGDDAAAKAKVMALLDEIGFEPVDAGGLDESWRQQPGTPGFGKDLDAAAWRRALAEASPERPAAHRA